VEALELTMPQNGQLQSMSPLLCLSQQFYCRNLLSVTLQARGCCCDNRSAGFLENFLYIWL